MNRTDQAKLVLQTFMEGGTLKAALIQHGMNSGDFHRQLVTHSDLAAQYTRAKEILSDLMASETLKIADDTSINPQHARNQIDARKWLASKWHRNTYGERVEVDIKQTVDISGALIEAKRRAQRLSSDSTDVEDIQAIDSTALLTDKTSDVISVEPIKTPIANPFDD
ncbi:terminase small subunit-like protein [Nitrosovibrio sp. Nv4]|uniref:terminase small subunit-like protein n=1 Tax=Nitrosovibrio sp. Nv4 TaxID=1945880 RepID=UPI000BD75DCA|nr:hypothetical protein [Nitrosovibrio sp. Nv4]SOD41334.1 hypothetical protein SAMN06298226_1629 [Nitrosovibrio sp. Nv4]